MTGIEIATIIISGITCLFAGISACSIIVMYIQMKKSHEEKRREKTVEILWNWTNSLQKEFRYAEKIVELLSEDQCRSLYNHHNFSVDNDIKNMLCEICSKSQNCEECKDCSKQSDGRYKVEGKQLSELRWYVTSYLNSLETVMVAWQQNIVDRETIEEQFQYLSNSSKGTTALGHYRNVAGGGNAFPALTEFYTKMTKKESKPKSKSKL